MKRKARALGFDAVGIARADLPLSTDHARWRAFVDAGMHGSMGWLAENGEARRRIDGDEILAGAKSVVCVARRYQRAEGDEAKDPPLARGIARYARGQDYHGFLRKKLRRLAAFVRTLGGEARPLCDDAPILERAWAARAGLGFVGKNGLLIVPGAGSMLLLGEVVTTLDLPADEPLEGRCGSCTRCLDACPTGAFPEPFVLDARRCVSYLTIESREPAPPSLRPAMGEHVFGCDDCQTVCPFNRGQAAPAKDARAFAPLARWSERALEELVALEQGSPAWDGIAEGSPVKRATAAGLAASAAVVLGNRGDPAALPALHAAAAGHPDARVRDAASWAIAAIEGRTTPP